MRCSRGLPLRGHTGASGMFSQQFPNHEERECFRKYYSCNGLGIFFVHQMSGAMLKKREGIFLSGTSGHARSGYVQLQQLLRNRNSRNRRISCQTYILPGGWEFPAGAGGSHHTHRCVFPENPEIMMVIARGWFLGILNLSCIHVPYGLPHYNYTYEHKSFKRLGIDSSGQTGTIRR